MVRGRHGGKQDELTRGQRAVKKKEVRGKEGVSPAEEIFKHKQDQSRQRRKKVTTTERGGCLKEEGGTVVCTKKDSLFGLEDRVRRQKKGQRKKKNPFLKERERKQKWGSPTNPPRMPEAPSHKKLGMRKPK